MDQTTYENWLRVKQALEESGKTDSFFYERACAIVKTRQDPGPMPPTFA